MGGVTVGPGVGLLSWIAVSVGCGAPDGATSARMGAHVATSIASSGPASVSGVAWTQASLRPGSG
jgi:hypothetical protein